MILKHLVVLVTALLLAAPAGAFAHDSGDDYAAWYESLKQNGTGIPCCSKKDCHTVTYRIGPSAVYQAYVENGWVDIPEDRVVIRENPTGDGVLCRSELTGKIWCFIAGEEG